MPADAPEAVEITGEPAGVYRFYDPYDVLLYVGISRNLASRWEDHAAHKQWWGQVTRKTVMMYGSREEAEAAEAAAILSESPVHNIAGRTPPRRPRAAPRRPSLEDMRAARLARLAQERLPVITWPREVESLVYEYAAEHHMSPADAYSAFFMGGLVRAFWTDLEATEAGRAMTPEELQDAVAARINWTQPIPA